MPTIQEKLKQALSIAFVTLVVGCGSEEVGDSLDRNGHKENADAAAKPDGAEAELDAELEAACASYPSLPMCDKDPKPGFAKFAVGAADGVRWTGNVSCRQIDVRTGRHGEDRLTKSSGKVISSCNDEQLHFEFVHRKLRKELTPESWISAFRPLTPDAANQLLRSCSGDPTPKPSAVMNGWWKANNTYAENMMLDFISPVVLATELLPFSDQGIERLGEESVDGVDTITFRNAKAKVWMHAQGEKNRPHRVVQPQDDVDVYFTEWGKPFPADIPVGIRSLSEICEVN